VRDFALGFDGDGTAVGVSIDEGEESFCDQDGRHHGAVICRNSIGSTLLRM